MASSAGYSGTALVKKLGIKPGVTWVVENAPPEYRSWLGELPQGVRIVARSSTPIAAGHIFAVEKKELERSLKKLRVNLAPAGFIWVSWPKKAAKVKTDITEDTIRAVALPLDFVDIKVCAVTDVWSGLKLMIRKERRD